MFFLNIMALHYSKFQISVFDLEMETLPKNAFVEKMHYRYFWADWWTLLQFHHDKHLEKVTAQ